MHNAPANTPMHMDDPARLELIASTRPDMLLPHQREMLSRFGDRIKTLAFPQDEVPAQADRQAA